MGSSTRASSLPSSFAVASPYDSPYDYDDTLPALRRSSSIASSSTTASSFSSRPSMSSLRSSVSTSTSSLASLLFSTSFRRGSSTASSLASSVPGGGAHSPPSSLNRRSSSICWIQDGSSDDDNNNESFEDDTDLSPYSISKSVGKEEEDGCGVNLSMISTSTSSSSSSSSSASVSSSSSSNAIDLLDAEETSLSYDDSDGEDVAFLFGTPSSSYDMVKPASLSKSSKASEATKRSARFVLAHPLLMATLVFVASFAAGGMLARRHLMSQLAKVRLQHQSLLDARTELLATHPQLSKVPTGTKGPAVTKSVADETQELQDQLDVLQAELHAKKFELERVTEDRKAREQDMLDAIDKLGPIVSGMHKQRRRTSATASATAGGVMLDQDEGSYQHKEAIAHLVKTMAYDQFGSEIQDVEFHVRYYPDNYKDDGDKVNAATEADAAAPAGLVEGRFVVEVADFESNPLSSFLFLQQVDHGLWDDTSFHVNAPHMLLAQPASAHVANATTKAPTSRLPEMQALGLSRLPIMEYNDEWGRHDKYTLGLGSATATAGSFFFLNKMDNSKTHDGQACFAQVVEGTEVVDAIFALSNYDANFRLRRPVEIVSVKIVDYSNDQDVEEGPDHDGDSHHHRSGDHDHRGRHGDHVVHRRGSRRDHAEDAHHQPPKSGHKSHDHDAEHHDEGEHLNERDEAVVADH